MPAVYGSEIPIPKTQRFLRRATAAIIADTLSLPTFSKQASFSASPQHMIAGGLVDVLIVAHS